MPLQFRNPDLVALLSADFVLRRDPARTLRATANLSDPPTDAELTANLGALSDLPNDAIFINDDAGGGTRTYGILTDRTNNKWWRWKMYADGEAMPGSGSVSFAVPNLTLGTANAEGVATTSIRSDATILAFDATVPGTIVPDASAAAGSAAVAARRDHTHGIATAAAVTLTSTSTNTEGTGNNFARATHTHAITFFDATTPAQLTPDIAASAGSASVAARRDHVHNVPAATAVGLSVSSTSTEGASTSFARANHTHAITTSSDPGAASQILKSDSNGSLFLERLGVGVSSVSANGNIQYAGSLQSYKNSTAYTAYAYVPLTTPLTSTSWDGDAKGVADSGALNLVTVFGLPANVAAVHCRAVVRTTGAVSAIKYFAVGNNTSYYSLVARTTLSNYYAEVNGNVPMNGNNVYVLFGDTVENVRLEIYGYFI
jgi:hypothetical protein